MTINYIKNRRTGFPLTIVFSLGRVLKKEMVLREVRVGGCFVDFATVTPYYKKGIEVDGASYHRDVLKEQARDRYLAGYGMSILHVDAASIYRNPRAVQQRVLEWLAK